MVISEIHQYNKIKKVRTSLHQENYTASGAVFYLPQYCQTFTETVNMKNLVFFPVVLFISACANGKEKAYTGSTPAAQLVRAFLGISLTDSIDFIRWNLTLAENQYSLQCNYGIGKPNTNGFYDGGKKVSLTGTFNKVKNIYQLQYGEKALSIAELNNNLIHILNNDKSLMIGNGGFSYTLNNLSPAISDEINLPTAQIALKDSISFIGRTPCGVPGVVPNGKECYKLKWRIVFYAQGENNVAGKYKIPGSPWYKEGGRKGTWKIIKGKDDRTIYQLNDDKGDIVINLLKLDEGVIIFTDAKGNLLVGDLDFSYTLNRE